jgi:hypothetical protein
MLNASPVIRTPVLLTFVALVGCQQQPTVNPASEQRPTVKPPSEQRPTVKPPSEQLPRADTTKRQGPRVGAVIELQGLTYLFLLKEDYEQYTELKAAGAHPGEWLSKKNISPSLERGSQVRVLSTVSGGVKVVVERAMLHDLGASMDAQKRILKDDTGTLNTMRGTIGYISLGDIP